MPSDPVVHWPSVAPDVKELLERNRTLDAEFQQLRNENTELKKEISEERLKNVHAHTQIRS